ncbi:hypothetical protein OHS58_27735 [Amycolatopsis sp. NBC_00348]|uniref:hypothetical protein n=1 Tax=Amycolatopsis sp. NBC_00348 TaxID=2975956 RepID=UPI002E25A62C
MLVPADRRVGSMAFVHVERTTRLPPARVLREIPTVPTHRAVIDAARRMRNHDAVVAMMAEAIQRRRCTPEALARELADGKRAGRALPARALSPLLGGARSVAEVDAWRLLGRSKLPECRWNIKLFTAGGRYIATPDALVGRGRSRLGNRLPQPSRRARRPRRDARSEHALSESGCGSAPNPACPAPQ